MNTDNITTSEQLAEAKTKMPQRTLDLINEMLKQKGITIYEYLQMCSSLVLRYASPDSYWQQMTEPVKSALMSAIGEYLTHPDENVVKAARQSIGMYVADKVGDEIESATITTGRGCVYTVQSPGLFKEFSTSINDALFSIISADRPLADVMSRLQERHPEATCADIVLTALTDMLEVEQGQPVGDYAANVYGRVPIRHPNR